MTSPRPRLLKAQQVAEMTTLAESTLYDWAHRGVGPASFKLGSRRVWDERVVLAWLEEQASGKPVEADEPASVLQHTRGRAS